MWICVGQKESVFNLLKFDSPSYHPCILKISSTIQGSSRKGKGQQAIPLKTNNVMLFALLFHLNFSHVILTLKEEIKLNGPPHLQLYRQLQWFECLAHTTRCWSSIVALDLGHTTQTMKTFPHLICQPNLPLPPPPPPSPSQVRLLMREMASGLHRSKEEVHIIESYLANCTHFHL